MGLSVEVIGLVASITELSQALAHRRYQLGMTSRVVDDLAGLADGHTSKLECGTKNLGDVTLPALLATYGLKLVLVASDDDVPSRVKPYLHTAKVSSSYPRSERITGPASAVGEVVSEAA